MRMTAWVQVGAAVLVGACGLAGAAGGGDDEPLPEPILTLSVENQNFYDATLYAVGRSGEQQRIGAVGGNHHGTFSFRWLQSELRVMIRLLAGGTTTTEYMLVSPGDSLRLIVQPDLHLKIPPDR